MRQFGFDILTADERTFYPLATENEKDTEEWVAVLNKVLGGLESEDQGTCSYYSIYKALMCTTKYMY